MWTKKYNIRHKGVTALRGVLSTCSGSDTRFMTKVLQPPEGRITQRSHKAERKRCIPRFVMIGVK